MEELQNDKVQLKVHRKSNCVVEYEVHASALLVLDAQKKALREVGKDVVLPGFRKGKAPLEVVAKRFPQELDKRWQQIIADASYREAAMLAKVPLLRSDTKILFNMISHSPQGAHLTLSFETIPEVPAVDLSQFQLGPIEKHEVTPDKVAEAMRQIRYFFASWEKIEGRPVQEGDYILIDLDNLETDPPTTVFSSVRFEVVDKHMAKWMKELVLGKQVGETSEGVSVPDDNLPEEQKAEFKPRRVRLTVKAIEKTDLPELNDDLAKQLGLSKVEEIEPRVTEILTKIAAHYEKEKKREQVTKFLDGIHFELPRSLIEREAEFRFQQMVQNPGAKEEWEGLSSDKRKQQVAGWLQEAEKAVRLFYLCRTLLAKERISISPADLETLPADPLDVMLNPSAHMHDPRTPEIKQAEAYSRLMLEKAADWILEHSSAVAQ
jgi:trigger factor